MLGITIGSLNTSISYYEKGQFKILLSDTSNRSFPSVVSIQTRLERSYGEQAIFNIKSNLDTSIFGILRFLSSDIHQLNKELSFQYICKQNLDFEQKSFYTYLLNFNNLISKCFNISEEVEYKTGNNFKSIYKHDNLCLYNLIVSYFSKIFQHIKRYNKLNLEIYASTSIISSNVQNIFAITIPDYLNNNEKNILIKLLNISDINSLKKENNNKIILVNESSAITMYYAYEKSKKIRELTNSNDNKKLFVAFIDIGHSKTAITYSLFEDKHFEVYYVLSNKNLGIRNIDNEISNYLLMEFDKENNLKDNKSLFNLKQYYKNYSNDNNNINNESSNNNNNYIKYNLEENYLINKLLYKLNESVVKARRILTSNEETNISIDSFYKDIDLNIKLTRNLFNSISNNILVKLENCLVESLVSFIDKLKNDSNILNLKAFEFVKNCNKNDLFNNKERIIDSVEMAGDGARIPIIQNIIEEKVFKCLKLSKTILTDECISKGTCLYATRYSKALSCEDYTFKNYFNNNIVLSRDIIREGDTKSSGLYSANLTLIKKGTSFPVKNSYIFSNLSEVTNLKFYSDNNLLISNINYIYIN